MTVIVDEATGVEIAVLMVKVELQVGEQEIGLKLPLAPLGKPDTVNDTAEVEPAESVEVIVLATAAPAATDLLPPLVKLKSKLAGGGGGGGVGAGAGVGVGVIEPETG